MPAMLVPSSQSHPTLARPAVVRLIASMIVTWIVPPSVGWSIQLVGCVPAGASISLTWVGPVPPPSWNHR